MTGVMDNALLEPSVTVKAHPQGLLKIHSVHPGLTAAGPPGQWQHLIQVHMQETMISDP